MKKVFRLIDLDCPNCAMKIEDAIKQINGINQVNVSFLTQKLTIETEENNYDIEAAKEYCSSFKRNL